MKAKHITFLILISILTFAFTILSWQLLRFKNHALIQTSDTSQIIELGKSASAYQFAKTLKDKGYISSVRLFVNYLRFFGLDKKLRAGIYQIKPMESASDLVNRVVSGDVMVFSFTIIAGTTESKIASDLQHTQYLNYNAQDWQSIKGLHQNAEGLLLADTYQYQGGSDSKSLLNQASSNLTKYLSQSWETREKDLPYKNAYEMLTAASIIEKETGIATERPLISGVIVNRLKKYMPLQMDPTVIYALGDRYKGKLSHQDMQVDSPYNSYRYRGLPPTPIAMVGKDAIDAAAHPKQSKYLYFVSKGDGTHQFSETYEEQRQAIKRYQR